VAVELYVLKYDIITAMGSEAITVGHLDTS
jgi:hypothetical protein